MKASKLLEFLRDVDPNAEVVVRAPDHGYARALAVPTEATLDTDGGLCEYHGPAHMEAGDQCVPVIVITSRGW